MECFLLKEKKKTKHLKLIHITDILILLSIARKKFSCLMEVCVTEVALIQETLGARNIECRT